VRNCTAQARGSHFIILSNCLVILATHHGAVERPGHTGPPAASAKWMVSDRPLLAISWKIEDRNASFE
jgi:hypothetical protein